MGRRKLGALKITNNDKSVFLSLAKCHVITNDLATEFCHVGEKRLDRLSRGGYLDKDTVIVNNVFTTIFKLSEEGKKYAKVEVEGVCAGAETGIGKGALYHGAGNSGAEHDLDLCKYFLSLPQIAQQKALVETEITRIYGSGIKNFSSPPDLLIPEYTIETENQLVTIPMEIVEGVTMNYSKEEVEAKVTYINNNIPMSKGVIRYVGKSKHT